MTVAELRDELKQFNPDLPVTIWLNGKWVEVGMAFEDEDINNNGHYYHEVKLDEE